MLSIVLRPRSAHQALSPDSRARRPHRRRPSGRAGVQGPGGRPVLPAAGQMAKLQAALDRGPAAWGWGEDKRWTLAWVSTLIGRLFHVQ
jgi:hypothetical protein